MSFSSSTLTIRPFQQEDLSACVRLFQSNTPEFFSASELPEFQMYLGRYATGSYWVCEFENNIIGCGGIRVRPDGYGSLCYGMVDTNYHGQGIGAALMNFRLQKFLEYPDVQKIRLDTSQHSYGFFKKFGFSVCTVEPDFYGKGLDCYHMERDINPDPAITPVPEGLGLSP